jgi:hypothetical protein
MIFIAHSLGGLILKEALRQSWAAPDYQHDLKTIYKATRVVIFLGTPHRGSAYANWGLIARDIAISTGFDATATILRDLKIDSVSMEFLRKEFAKMLKEETFDVFTFKEGKGLKGLRSFTAKVSPNTSREYVPFF